MIIKPEEKAALKANISADDTIETEITSEELER